MPEGSPLTRPLTVAETAAQIVERGRTMEQAYYGFTGRVLVSAAYEGIPVLDTDGEGLRSQYFAPELNAWGRLCSRIAGIGLRDGEKLMIKNVLATNRAARLQSPSITIYDRNGRAD